MVIGQGAGNPLLGGNLQKFIQDLSDLRLGISALEKWNRLPHDHRENRGNRLNLECSRHSLLSVNINFGEDPATGVLSGQFLQDRRQLLARPTPLGP